MTGEGDLRSLRLALGVYLFVFAAKLAGYFLTGVLALMAEALHTLSDIFISGFLLLAARYSRKEPDELHMFGHGRAQNVAALVAATLFVSFTSLRLYEEAIPRLLRPVETDYQNLGLALGVILGSLLLSGWPLARFLLQEDRSPAARAQVLELINDELGLLAALLGTLFLLWGMPLADPLAAAVVATLIAYNGVRLFLENFSDLLGRSPGPEALEKIEALARSVPGVLGVHDLRAEYVGPHTIHAGMHIQVEPDMSVAQADRLAEQVHERVHTGTQGAHCYIRVEAGEEEGAQSGHVAR